MVAQEAADVSFRVGSLVKSAGQPYARNPHVRLEEGAPVGTPWRDIQALPTERGSSSYGPSYSTTRPGPTLQARVLGAQSSWPNDLCPLARPRTRGRDVQTTSGARGRGAYATYAQVLELYPYLEGDDVKAALSFAAWRAEEINVPLRAS